MPRFTATSLVFKKLSTLAATAVCLQEMIDDEFGPVAGEQAAHGGCRRRLGQKVIETIREWSRRASSRRELMALDTRDLWDLRLTRADAMKEGGKSFWKE